MSLVRLLVRRRAVVGEAKVAAARTPTVPASGLFWDFGIRTHTHTRTEKNTAMHCDRWVRRCVQANPYTPSHETSNGQQTNTHSTTAPGRDGRTHTALISHAARSAAAYQLLLLLLLLCGLHRCPLCVSQLHAHPTAQHPIVVAAPAVLTKLPPRTLQGTAPGSDAVQTGCWMAACLLRSDQNPASRPFHPDCEFVCLCVVCFLDYFCIPLEVCILP